MNEFCTSFKCDTEQNCAEMWMYVSWVTVSQPLVAVPSFAVWNDVICSGPHVYYHQYC